MTLENILKKSKPASKYSDIRIIRINKVIIGFNCVELSGEVFIFYITDLDGHNIPTATIHKDFIRTLEF